MDLMEYLEDLEKKAFLLIGVASDYVGLEELSVTLPHPVTHPQPNGHLNNAEATH